MNETIITAMITGLFAIIATIIGIVIKSRKKPYVSPIYNASYEHEDDGRLTFLIINNGENVRESSLIPYAYMEVATWKGYALAVNSERLNSYAVELIDYFSPNVELPDNMRWNPQVAFDPISKCFKFSCRNHDEKLGFCFCIFKAMEMPNISLHLRVILTIYYVDYNGRKHNEWYECAYDTGGFYKIKSNKLKKSKKIKLNQTDTTQLAQEFDKALR